MNRMIVFIALVILSSCMVGPDYRRPFVDIPASYHYEPADARATLNLDWWKQFDDCVLVGLINEALVNNKDVKIAAANISNAIGVLIQTRSPLFPQIGYSATYDRTRISETLVGTSGLLINPQTTLRTVANANWTLDIWGRIRRLTESAAANIFATYEARQQVILSLVASVANAYIELRGLDEQLAISLRTMKSYKEAVDYFQLQFDYGQESQMAVAQAQTQYETAAATVPAIQRQIAVTENTLCILLGKNPEPIPRGKNIYDLKLPAVPASLPSEILFQRPDIKQAEGELIAANAQIGAAQALYFPSISLTGDIGNASDQLQKLFTGPSHTWDFLGAITGPIFTGGSIYGQVLQARSETQALLINYQKIIQNAFSEVEDALITHTLAIQQLDVEEKLVKAAGEYVKLASLQYKAGYAPYFVVIQAQQQYFPSELSWAKTRADVCSSLVSIYQSIGGGWVDIAENIADGTCNCQ